VCLCVCVCVYMCVYVAYLTSLVIVGGRSGQSDGTGREGAREEGRQETEAR
jgi:hypothetical protein